MKRHIAHLVVAAALAAGTLLAVGTAEAQQQDQRLSPLDSVKATVEGAQIHVQYGRPSQRDPDTGEDREIFGGLVSYGQVWRTGANEATHLRTTADLRIGDTRIPAGHYTLYTIPRPDSWTLIVNEQTGQWGTRYDESRDLARIPLQVESLESDVDTFTIDVTSDAGDHDGALVMEWETTRARAPFDVLEQEE